MTAGLGEARLPRDLPANTALGGPKMAHALDHPSTAENCLQLTTIRIWPRRASHLPITASVFSGQLQGDHRMQDIREKAKLLSSTGRELAPLGLGDSSRTLCNDDSCHSWPPAFPPSMQEIAEVAPARLHELAVADEVTSPEPSLLSSQAYGRCAHRGTGQSSSCYAGSAGCTSHRFVSFRFVLSFAA